MTTRHIATLVVFLSILLLGACVAPWVDDSPPDAATLTAEGQNCELDAECDHGTCLEMGGIGGCAAECVYQQDCPGYLDGSQTCFLIDGGGGHCLNTCGLGEPYCADGSLCHFAGFPNWWVCWPITEGN